MIPMVSRLVMKKQLEEFNNMTKTHEDRMTGTFYTPDLFVEEAHRYIEKEFGINWKEDYIVFDNSAGGFNLTKNHKFKELYCSTLEQEDIDKAIANNINPEAIKFQFDFLNDDLNNLPDGLKDAINNNKKIIIFMNPPYAAASNMKFKDDNQQTKKGVGKTVVNLEMLKEKWGGASNLYSQFIYRCFKLNELNNNIELCFFVKSNYKTGPSYKNFRKNFYSKYQFKSGFLFNAKYFAGCSSDWSVDFSIWRNGVETRDELESDIVDIVNNKIEKIGTKVLYNLDNKLACSEWVRQEVKGLKTVDGPQMSSGLKVKQTGRGRRIAEGQLGYSVIKNNVYYNQVLNTIISELFADNHGVYITKENIDKIIALFYARTSVNNNPMNWQDEYSAPKEEIEFIGCINNDSNTIQQKNVIFLATSNVFANGNINISQENIDKIIALFNARKSINDNWLNDKDEYIAPDEEIEFIGYLVNKGNDIQNGSQGAILFTDLYFNGNGVNISQENIDKAISLFNARKSIKSDYLNDKDQYIAPEEEIEFIGVLLNRCNDITHNIGVALLSENISEGHGVSITPENIDKVIALFNSRNEIKPTFINSKDEYIEPKEEIEFIGCMNNHTNNVQQNRVIFLVSDSIYANGNMSISNENIDKVISIFNARKSIKGNYLNDKDEYIAPDETIQLFKFKIPNPLYVQYVNDSYVYSLFNNSSQQSSMNKVMYKNKEYKIKNEFFYMSKEEMKELAIKYNFNEMIEDININGLKERFVYNRLLTTPLSPDALEVLEQGKELIRLTFEKRIELHREKPEYHLDCWDAGWYQLNKILKEYSEFKDIHKEFRKKYKDMEDRMRPLVYQLGFNRFSCIK